MMPAASRLAPVSGADPVLNAMVEELATRLQAGAEVDLEAIARRDPERAELLRQLLPSIRMMADLGRSMICDAASAGSSAANPAVLGVLGDFRILREVGRGGMGIVYEAEQVSLGRRVALKVLPFAAAVDPKQLARFHVEAQAAAHLHHTNIVPVYAVGCERGLNFYAMQFIEGPSLAAVIRELRRRGGREAADPPVAADVASELAGDLTSGRFAPTRSKTGPGEGHTTPDDSPRTPDSRTPAAAETVAAGSRSTRGHAYFRAAAHLGVQAAEALDYAHGMGVVHRDIKPGNLMVDPRGNLWITDFGLARIQDGSDLTMTGDLLGTLRFMSPEQVLAKRVAVDFRTDVYSLGVTLYELLTLEPAFAGRDRQEVLRRIAFEEPRPPRRINPSIPRDLETIVLKAMTKDPNGRYSTAQEFAIDLRRFLEDKPIRARRPTPMERAAKWSRRHQATVVAVFAILVVAIAALSFGAVLMAREQRQTAAARDEAEARALVQQLLRLLPTPHSDGWSGEAWDLVRRSAQRHKDDALQEHAVACLAGLDGQVAKRFADFGATSVAFDQEGRRLLMGGVTDAKDSSKSLGTRLWDDAAEQLDDTQSAGDGPVGFRADGTPVQLVTDGDRSLSLMDLVRRVAIHRFEMAGTLDRRDGVVVGMLPDASLVGAVVRGTDGPALVVWDGLSGRQLHRFATQARCLALSPDRTLAAGGDDAGNVSVWSLETGREVMALPSGRTKVHCLAFGADRTRHPGGGPRRAGGGWLLAAGHAGGMITIWDVGRALPRAYCHGSHFDVYAVAFSPDSTTLASAGRGSAKLWDVGTGRPLLNLGQVLGDFQFGLAFSPDGRRLATGSFGAFGWPGRVTIWDLMNGRGIRTLRGLAGQVEKVAFSHDGRLVAALSQDWQVAIWDRATGQLRHRLDVPQGLVADNAGLAFSPEGRRFAAAAGHAARWWDLDTGAELGEWSLPEGMTDTLAFRGEDRLLLLRVETRDSKLRPDGNADPVAHPRVCRLRALTSGGRAALIKEIEDFNWNVVDAVVDRGGDHFVVAGRGGPRGEDRRIRVYDGRTGKLLWDQAPRGPLGSAVLLFDPAGEYLIVHDSSGNGAAHMAALLEVPSWEFVGYLDAPKCLGPGARLWTGLAYDAPGRGAGIHLSERGRERPLVRFRAEPGNGLGHARFSPDGLALIWGNTDGTVAVCDLKEIQQRLAAFGLGW